MQCETVLSDTPGHSSLSRWVRGTVLSLGGKAWGRESLYGLFLPADTFCDEEGGDCPELEVGLCFRHAAVCPALTWIFSVLLVDLSLQGSISFERQRLRQCHCVRLQSCSKAACLAWVLRSDRRMPL